MLGVSNVYDNSPLDRGFDSLVDNVVGPAVEHSVDAAVGVVNTVSSWLD